MSNKGALVRRSKTSWTARWWATDPATGKYRQYTKAGFRRQGDGQKFLNTVLPQVDAGTWKPEKPLKVSELLLEQYIPARQSEGLAESSISQMRYAAKWTLPYLGGLDVQSLTPAKLSEVVDTLRASGSRLGRGGLKPRSVQVAVSTLMAATAWGAATGLLARDPLAGMRRPRAKASTVGQASSVEEARCFLHAVRNDRFSAAWKLFFTRGPRRGELAGLTWSRVDLDRGGLQITATRIVVDGKAVESTPKTNAGRRWIPLDEELVAAFKAHRRRQLEERMAAGPAYDDTDYVFCDELGRPFHPEFFSTRFETLVRQAGLRQLRLHDTRHTACSVMLSAGESPYVVSRILGHSSTRMVEQVYRHLMGDELERAGQAASKLLLSAESPSA